jgi:hypothetical protein
MVSKTIYIEYRVSGALASAYEVTLASEDGTYGIKRKSNGDVVVSSGTAVDNPSLGRYEYTVSLDETVRTRRLGA